MATSEAPRHRRRRAGFVGALVLGLIALGAAAPRALAARPSPRAAVGGTAYFAEQPGSPPNYIFPIVSGAYYSTANVSDFQTLLYRPLYWFGDQGRPGLDPALSLAEPPRYGDGGTTVTITLHHAVWSDGEVVSARDVELFINLVKANRAAWASYVPGGFPDNITSMRVLGPATLELGLDRRYNPQWYTDNELSQITPLPIAWDKTSPGAPAPRPGATHLPDATARGARAVYSMLNAEALKLSSYASSPIWSVVDGAFKLQSLTSEGLATFVANPAYDGPDRPHLARFVELPFTSEEAEFSLLESGPASETPAAGDEQVSVGYVPDTDLPARGRLSSRGYRLAAWFPFQFDYFEPNYHNPIAGPIFRQLYFRQAFQHLVDEKGWIHAFYGGLGAPTYGPVPDTPANPYADALEARDPYPFDVAAAKALLAAHGWRVEPGGVTRCVAPGEGAHRCGAGIARGARLAFSLEYPSGLSYTDSSMVDLQSVARSVGIALSLHEVSISTIDSTILPCAATSPACSWQLGQYGQGWLFAPDHYPSGEEIFATGAAGNVASYSDPAIDKLIAATTTAAPSSARSALDAYQNAVRLAVPNFWQPSPGTLVAVQHNLHGVTMNAYGFISPEEWYLSSRRSSR